MDLLDLCDERPGGVGEEKILQIVMDMIGLAARGLAGHIVAVDREGQVSSAVPGMKRQALDAGFLLGFARRGKMEVLGLLPMATGLEPAADHDMVDQQDLCMVRG